MGILGLLKLFGDYVLFVMKENEFKNYFGKILVLFFFIFFNKIMIGRYLDCGYSLECLLIL